MAIYPGVLSLIFVATALAGSPNEQNINHLEILQPSKGIIGIASIAGITNRNGRVSSVTGVKLIPSDSERIITNISPFPYPLTSDSKRTVTSLQNTSPFLYPLSSVTREDNGKFASGSIQFHPGSVTVSSTTTSGHDWKAWPKINIPLPSNMFLQNPLDLFEPPNYVDPWFPKDIFQKQVNLPRGWLYPHFDPFVNFWR